MSSGSCRRPDCNEGCIGVAISVLAIGDVWCVEHHTAWQVYVMLGAKGLNEIEGS